MLTGAFVCHNQLYLDQLEEVVRGFEAPVIAVLGNHDHGSGADAVKRALERGGAAVLCNANTVITLGRERKRAEPGRGAVHVGAGIGAAVMPLRLGERGSAR